jgi:hypothetical protein
MGFLKHIRVLNIKIISQINLFLIFLKKTIDKYKFKLNFMCFSVALFYNFFLCGKLAFLCGESNSSILTDERQMSELIDLCKFSPGDNWSLLYRATMDGFGSRDFHSRCYGHSNTLTILKAKQSSYIFGGFTSVSWESPTNKKFKSDTSAFIFSLTNGDNQPVKMKIIPNIHQYAIYYLSSVVGQ